MGEPEQHDKLRTLGHTTLTGDATRATPSPGKDTHTAHALPRTTSEAGARRPEAAPQQQAPADLILPGQSPRPSASKTQAAGVQNYSDMLAVVLAARDLTDHAQPEDPEAHAQILGLLAPLEKRLNELNDHQGRLAQFGAGNIAGQATLDMAETAIRTWRQRLMLGTIVRTEELVLRFRSAAEVLRFLTEENADAPTLREFNHVSGLVGVGAAVPVLAPGLVALAAEEAALLAFAGRVAARRVVLWALSNPAAALAASEALVGFGVQIGEGGWESFWNQLQDPQGRWFVIAQVLMDYMHVKASTSPHGEAPSRPRTSGTESAPDVGAARQQAGKARAVLLHVHDAAAASPEQVGKAPVRDGSELRHRPTGEASLEPPGAGPTRGSGTRPYPDNPHGHVEQRKPDWCGAACGEMSARRLGVEVDQADLAATPHFIPTVVLSNGKELSGGFQAPGLADALTEVAQIPGRVWVGGDIPHDVSTPAGLRAHLAGYLSATKPPSSFVLALESTGSWLTQSCRMGRSSSEIRARSSRPSSARSS